MSLKEMYDLLDDIEQLRPRAAEIDSVTHYGLSSAARALSRRIEYELLREHREEQ